MHFRANRNSKFWSPGQIEIGPTESNSGDTVGFVSTFWLRRHIICYILWICFLARFSVQNGSDTNTVLTRNYLFALVSKLDRWIGYSS
ncbi:hypothetical protein M6B38_332480 [Iris pallida]|uniref:Photosystem II protein N n=1 Tax=Iris pallida TaxID=29817 RepID=A0AAX6H495_IRIPA|nr:hypothetical protein M6B38_332480 [Iris pallida]